MTKRNPHLAKLKAGYLFPEIQKRKKAFLKDNPQAQLINLGIGDTTIPLPLCVAERMQHYAMGMATVEGYSGYGPEQGQPELRKKIAARLYSDKIDFEEIFVSDGAKCDISRLQLLFGSHATIAVQDPAYPVYVDTSVMIGQTGEYQQNNGGYSQIVYMPCTPSNGFFPDLANTPRTDLIYFCSPNNPTGAVATRQQLEELVLFAKRNRSILIFDAAYGLYIRDPKLARSIYEIPGAKEVAIEIGSFSKMAGFTGLRLGWVTVPHELRFEDGTPIRNDWERIHTTCFNGASSLVQQGGIAVLEEDGWQAIQEMVTAYMDNATLIVEALQQQNIAVYGGVNAPYIWAYFEGRLSWDVFEDLMQRLHIVSTPGSGFGPAGEGFIRLSAFAPREQIKCALERLMKQSVKI